MEAIKQRVKGFQHIGLPTNDLEKTLEFYTALGFEPVYQKEHNGEKFCFMKLGDLCIETFENGNAADCAGAIDHIALDVDDVEAAWNTVKEWGYEPIDPEIQFLPFWERGVRYFNILGPNNEKVEFSQVL